MSFAHSEDERGVVKAMYGPHAVKWHQKVEKMTDAQIHAIYMRIVNEGPKKPEKPKEDFE